MANEASDGPGSSGPVIRTQGLTKVYTGRFGEVTAVDSLDLEVHRGEIFGLLGPNGAGKTTTVGMLTSMVVPTGGRAWVGGVDVVEDPARAKQVLGVVPQGNTLDRSLDVNETLYFHGRYFGMGAREARRVAHDLLERMRLTDRAKAEVDQLSGGMAQRLMVARAIMHRPSILFLDEPTAGLDPQSRLALWEIVGELHDQGQTILLTTHYMEEADQLCGRVAIMDHGNILALDTPTGLKHSIGADTEVCLTAHVDADGLATHMRSLDHVTQTRVIDGVAHVYMRGRPQLPVLLSHADAGGFTVNDVHVTEPTLETVFINLTGKDLRE